MKIEECEKRKNGRCVEYQNSCTPKTNLVVRQCWRMHKETEKFLQCPKCSTDLWIDISGPGDVLFCPYCDKEVKKREAAQTLRRLDKELERCEEVYRDFLANHKYEEASKINAEIERIRKMMLNLMSVSVL